MRGISEFYSLFSENSLRANFFKLIFNSIIKTLINKIFYKVFILFFFNIDFKQTSLVNSELKLKINKK